MTRPSRPPSHHRPRPLLRDRRAATIVEFALVAPVLLGFVCLALELGYRAYLRAVVQGALLDAARAASVGARTGDQIDEMVRARISVLTDRSNIKSITHTDYYNFSNVDRPEKLTTDANGNGSYDPGDCYQDADDNGHYTWNLPDGLGTADDVVRYSVVVTYPNLLPVGNLLKVATSETINASTVLRNQPFTSRAVPETRCTV